MKKKTSAATKPLKKATTIALKPKKVVESIDTAAAIEELREAGFEIEESQETMLTNLLQAGHKVNVNEVTRILNVDENENKKEIYNILSGYLEDNIEVNN